MRIIALVFAAMSLCISSAAIIEANPQIDVSIVPRRTVAAQTSMFHQDIVGASGLMVTNDSLVASSPSDPASAIGSSTLTLNDPYIWQQWALTKIKVQILWATTTGKPEILVAVLDTGIDKNHEELDGRVVAEINFSDSPTLSDIHGHGTHIAGIIAATSDNGKGITGLASGSRLMNIKVADDKGRCQASIVANGIIWAVDNGAKVINISLELKEPSRDLENAVEYAWKRGALVLAAAGNDGNELPIYPAYYESTIAVSALKEDDTLAPLSNYGDWVDVAAPGFNIYSTLPNDSYGYKSGTSFATAHVSGTAALLFSIANDINGNGRVNDEVRAAIEDSCQEIEISGVGKGRIDVAQSLDWVAKLACSLPQARIKGHRPGK